MKVGFASWNATKIKGKDLKSLVFSPSGVLVFEGNTLTFMACPEMKVKVFRPTVYASETKAVFASKNFNIVQQLEDDKEYIISFDWLFLNIYKETIYNHIMSIPGESL